MKKILQSILAILAIAVCSTMASAVWDSTLGNMPNTYQLCWGAAANSCLYGSTNGNYVRMQTGGIDALTVDTNQKVTVPGALTVAGTETHTGTETHSGSVTFSGGILQGVQEGFTPTTTTQLTTIVPISTGANVTVQFYTNGSLGSAFGNCIASGTTTGAWVYPSTSTSSPARGCF